VGSPPYPAVVRLVHYAAEYWGVIDGECASRGLDPFDLPFQRFLNFIYYWVINRIPAEEQEGWEFSLTEPLPWEKKTDVSPMTVEKEREAFDAFYAQITAPQQG
jgi:hypothetical protein